jgi:alcohol dehydrogenase class IV
VRQTAQCCTTHSLTHSLSHSRGQIEETGDAVGQAMLAEEVATFLRELLSQSDEEGLSLVRRIIKLIRETAPGEPSTPRLEL